MEQKSEKNELEIKLHDYGWSKKDIAKLNDVIETGAKPVSPTLASQMYQLFAEGYPISEIVRMNKGFTESDILYCRYKYQWDDKRNEYALQLTNQVQQKMVKQKLESVEYLTNMLAVIHKEGKDLMLKFLQTGNMEDLPKIGSLRQYKDIVEILAKITGEDSVKKVKFEGKVQQETTIKADQSANAPINEQLQTKLLEILAKEMMAGTNNGQKKVTKDE